MTNKQAVRWRFRRAVLSRDGHRCRHCNRPGYDRQDPPAAPGELVPLDAHHVRPRAACADDGYTLANGLPLCGECHKKEEAGARLA